MDVLPVDTNFQFRTLRSRNIPCDMRKRPNDRQMSNGQKPDIPPRSSSLKICSKVTPDKPQGQLNIPDKTLRIISKQDSKKLPIQP